jgi:cysteine desulfurase / selenocysteine lyase
LKENMPLIAVEKFSTGALDPTAFRAQFPLLQKTLKGGKPLVYLDNAATSQKPREVIDCISRYYTEYNSNIHRGAHQLAAQATEAYEEARRTVASFIGCTDPDLINFTKGTTESINLVASGLSKSWLSPGDEVLISAMEHHANIVPWQMACEYTGAVLKVIPVTDDGQLDLDVFHQLLSPRTKVLSLVWISNSIGTINPVQTMVAEAQRVGAQVLIDAAQAIVHERINVEQLGADYLAFSGHKVYGPTGIGILYGKRDRLEALPPYQGGGEMIKEVRFEGTTYNNLPYKFEAGTPNIAGGIGLGAALRFFQKQDRDQLALHEAQLTERAINGLQEIEGLRLYGPLQHRSSQVSFTVEGVHTYDLGVLLDQQGIAIRTGHHCCQPLMHRFGIEGTCRASFLPYNTLKEVDFFLSGLTRALTILRS